MADEEFGGLDDDGSSSGSGKGGSLKLIIIIVVVGIIAGAAGFFGNKFLSGGGSNKEQVKETDKANAGEVKEGEKQPAETQAKDNTGENKSGEVKTGNGETTANTQGSGKGLLDLEPFTVNLNDPFGRRYIEVELKLVIDKKELVDKIKSNELVMPKIRNDILMTISAKSYNDLRTVGGKETLSEEIQMRVNEILKQEMGIEPVIEVLQTKFLMQ